jgi:hypothetical protein
MDANGDGVTGDGDHRVPGPGIPRGKLTPLSVASQLGFETTPMAPRGLGEAFDATTREPAGGTADGDSSP